MRIRFAGYLAMGVVSAFLIVAYVASTSVAADWGFGLAIAAAAFSVLGLTEHELVIERDIDHGGMPVAR